MKFLRFIFNELCCSIGLHVQRSTTYKEWQRSGKTWICEHCGKEGD